MSAAGRAARPSTISAPQTSAVAATNGAWSSGKGLPREAAQRAELAEAGAEDHDPDAEADHQPDDPLLAIEPGVDRTHTTHAFLRSATSLVARSRPSTS